MQRPAHIVAVQQAPKPTDLVRGLEKRVIPVDRDVLSLNDILDVADRLRRDIPDSLDVLRNEQEMVGIDMPMLMKPRVLAQRQGLFLFTRPH